ncbi:MAG: hypothetical protein LBQ57_02005 [Spirochaetales bacterium]|jgi:hypothetical protein|nr:hypothetical protein [Spirochaetales bacterium]
MECEDFMRLFLELDNNEAPSAALAAHLESCALCAAQAKGLQAFMRSRVLFAEVPPEKDISAAVMARISGPAAKESPPETCPLSMGNWIGAGLLLILGMFLIPFSAILPELSQITPGLGLALPLALGLAVTVYAAFFIGSHMKNFSPGRVDGRRSAAASRFL